MKDKKHQNNIILRLCFSHEYYSQSVTHGLSQPCSYGCSSVSDTGASIAAGLTYYHVNHQLSPAAIWMLHCQPCSYGCSSVSDTINPAVMDAPVSVTLSTLQLWMLQCQWHYQPCSYGCSSVSDTGASITAVLISAIDTGASITAYLTQITNNNNNPASITEFGVATVQTQQLAYNHTQTPNKDY